MLCKSETFGNPSSDFVAANSLWLKVGWLCSEAVNVCVSRVKVIYESRLPRTICDETQA